MANYVNVGGCEIDIDAAKANAGSTLSTSVPLDGGAVPSPAPDKKDFTITTGTPKQTGGWNLEPAPRIGEAEKVTTVNFNGTEGTRITGPSKNLAKRFADRELSEEILREEARAQAQARAEREEFEASLQSEFGKLNRLVTKQASQIKTLTKRLEELEGGK